VQEQILVLQAREQAIAEAVYAESTDDRALILTAEDPNAQFAPLKAA